MNNVLENRRKTPVGRELDARTHRLGPSKATTAQTNEKSPFHEAARVQGGSFFVRV